MKKIILILSLIIICMFSKGQMIFNNQPNPRLKLIANQLVAIQDYQADGYMTFSLPYGGTLSSASTITVKKVLSDTLCGFYYHFKTHEKYRQIDVDFISLFGNAFYISKNGGITKTSLFDNPIEFKMKNIPKGFIPANYKRSLFFEVTPFQIGKFINDVYSRNEVITIQRPDTIINGKYCSKFILKDKIYNSPRKTELCFDKEVINLVYYRQDLNEGVNNQFKIVKFTNARINSGLPTNFFTEENICGKSFESGSTKSNKKQSLKVGQIIPDWELPVLNTNKKLSNKELKGNYILLEFTGTWSPHCWDAVKMMNRIEDKFKGNNKLSILSVFSTDIDNEEKITKFANEQEIKSTILYSAKSVGDKYFVTGYPFFFIIDPTGRLVLTTVGYSQDIENEIANYLRNNIK